LIKWAPKITIYGYARVSTDGQSLASQDTHLHAAGCAKVYAEKGSGAHSDRPELAKVLKRLRAGDMLMMVRLDRLACSTRDLLNILDAIGKADAGFKSPMPGRIPRRRMTPRKLKRRRLSELRRRRRTVMRFSCRKRNGRT